MADGARGKGFSPLLILPPLLFAGLAALFYFGVGRDNPNELPSTRIGQPAPALTVAPLGAWPDFGEAELRAPGVKLVNFWASWCAPCRAEHPTLEALADEGLTLYGINYKDDPVKAERFLDELGNPYTAIAADASGRTAIEWGVYGVPETYVIDSAGVIRLRVAGPITADVLKNLLRPALEAAR